MADEVKVILVGENRLSRPLQEAARDIQRTGNEAKKADGVFGRLASTLKGALITGLKGAAVAAAGLFAAFAIGLGGMIRAGWDGATSIENLSGRLNAFNKDLSVTAEMLEWARAEATRTPFAFNDIGNAIASVLPVANQLGVDYRELVRTGELLSALNPMEGIEGGVFSLKEALQGDFVSISERFGLDKHRLRELRDEGIPILQAVQQVLTEMGVDMDLVANQANTLTGRWDRLKETGANLFTAFATPVFNLVSESLGGLLDNLEGQIPDLEAKFAWAGQIVADAFRTFKEAWDGEWVDSEVIHPIHRAVGNFAINLQNLKQLIEDTFTTIQQAWSGEWVDNEIIHPVHRLAGILTGSLREGWDAFNIAIQTLRDNWEPMKQAFEDAIPVIMGVAIGIGAFVIGVQAAMWIAGLSTALGALAVALGTALAPVAAVVATIGGPMLLVIGLVAVAIGALTYAWQTNWGDIQGKTEAVWGVLSQAFSELKTWLDTNIPLAIETITEWWNTNLVPAFERAHQFMNESLIPLFDALGNVLSAVVEVAVRSLVKFWNESMQPALQDAWQFISDHLNPIFEDFAKKIGDTEKPIDDAGKKIQAMRDWFKELSDAIAGAVQWLNELAGAINGIPKAQGDIIPKDLPGGLAGGGGGGATVTGGAGGRGMTTGAALSRAPAVAPQAAAGPSVVFGAGAIVVYGGTAESVEAGVMGAFRRAGLVTA